MMQLQVRTGRLNRHFLLTGLILACCMRLPALAQESPPLRDAIECHPRSGLPNFRAKIEAGQHVKIGYLGGSITAAPGWRVQSLEWFARQFPKAKFEEINAAIGGTGSDLGVFRLFNDVLRHNPDLLFVEFAVNDGGASVEQIHKAMEGIVRQTWRHNPRTDLCFVYTLSEPMLGDLRAGQMQRSASAMEELADRYHIPSIHFGVKVVQLEKSGELVFKAPKPENLSEAMPIVFSTDGVHPHVETGHKLYTAAIERSWPAIRDAGTEPLEHVLPDPLRSDHWEQACQIEITPNMLRGPWKKLAADDPLGKRFQRNLPDLHQAMEPGAVLEFTIDGTAVAIFDPLGPDGGQVSVQIDDRKPETRNRIDAYCTYHRLSKLAVAGEFPAGLHRVRIELTSVRLDKRNILFEHNRADFDQHPEKYAPQTWYAGSLLVIGRVVSEANPVK